MDTFNIQLPAITSAFLEWSLDCELSGKKGFFDQRCVLEEANSGLWTGKVVDIFCESCPLTLWDCSLMAYYIIGVKNTALTISAKDAYIASALVRHGVIPCSPILPSVVITIEHSAKHFAIYMGYVTQFLSLLSCL